ncbi:hypothetical protein BLOT_015399 [Blomia tropicalis]|nr:hypothetical protein BLOT_015399 [Blomia tropicalis]
MKLTISATKTNLLYLHNHQKLPIKHNDTTIEPSEEIKILGIMIKNHRYRNKLNFNGHVDYIVNKTIRIKNILFSLCGRTWGIDSKKRLVLYKTIIRPILMYCSEVWFKYLSQSSIKKIESTQYNILIKCVHAYKHTSSAIVHSLSHIPLISDYNKALCLKKEILNNVNSPTNVTKLFAKKQFIDFLNSKFTTYVTQCNQTFRSFFPTSVPNYITLNKYNIKQVWNNFHIISVQSNGQMNGMTVDNLQTVKTSAEVDILNTMITLLEYKTH